MSAHPKECFLNAHLCVSGVPSVNRRAPPPEKWSDLGAKWSDLGAKPEGQTAVGARVCPKEWSDLGAKWSDLGAKWSDLGAKWGQKGGPFGPKPEGRSWMGGWIGCMHTQHHPPPHPKPNPITAPSQPFPCGSQPTPCTHKHAGARKCTSPNGLLKNHNRL